MPAHRPTLSPEDIKYLTDEREFDPALGRAVIKLAEKADDNTACVHRIEQRVAGQLVTTWVLVITVITSTAVGYFSRPSPSSAVPASAFAPPAPKKAGVGIIDSVYVTRTGNKYHRITCSYLKSGSAEISKSEAIDRGLSPCSRCRP